jgi:hypothetical protein
MCYDYEDARVSTLLFGVIITVISANARCYCVSIAVLHTLVAGLLARSQYQEGLRPATSAQVFLGFPVTKSES